MIVDVRPRRSGKSSDLLTWAAQPMPDEMRIVIVADRQREENLQRLSLMMGLPDFVRRNVYVFDEVIRPGGFRSRSAYVPGRDLRILAAFDDVDDILAILLQRRVIPAMATCSSEQVERPRAVKISDVLVPSLILGDSLLAETSSREKMVQELYEMFEPLKPLSTPSIVASFPYADDWFSIESRYLAEKVSSGLGIPKEMLEGSPKPSPAPKKPEHPKSAVETSRFAQLDLEEKEEE